MTPEVANAVLNYAIDCTRLMWIGGGFGGYWYCTGCGNPQLGEPPFGKVFAVRDRCRVCGPGRGYVRCPVDHSGHISSLYRCNLCRGEGWVEELGPAT